VISGFRFEVVKNYALLFYYATTVSYFLKMFQDNLSGPSFKDQEEAKENKNNDTWCCFTFDILQEQKGDTFYKIISGLILAFEDGTL
jgi:hypothetical protein